MSLGEISIIASIAIEIFVYIGLWRLRGTLYAISAPIGLFGATLILLSSFDVLSITLWLIMAYRCLNGARIILGRMQPKALKNVAFKAGVHILAMQVIILVLVHLLAKYPININNQWLGLSLLTLIGSLLVISQLLINLKKLVPQQVGQRLTDAALPSITVAVPARNETVELENMLAKLVLSDYPKLEIIVLDDCSQNKRTPEIIRAYANQGVRFLAGAPPPEGWLAKNYAYDQLAQAASGDIIVFMGVDIMLEPGSLRRIINNLLSKQKTMISLLPIRSAEAANRITLVQPMRYFWELVPPRRLFNRPPVLSSCWAIRRDKLQAYGGFKAITNSISPEAYFAKQAIKDNDSYRFSLSLKSDGLTSNKSTAAQRQTALRTRYPQLHKRLELVFLFGLFESLTLLAPFLLAVLSLFIVMPVLAATGFITASITLMASSLIIAQKTRVNRPLIAALSCPIVILYDLFILNYSLYKYEFSTISWKGRNVCEPVMQIIPHLPSI